MIARGVGADSKCCCNFRIGRAVCEQSSDLNLALGQFWSSFISAFVQRNGRKRGGDHWHLRLLVNGDAIKSNHTVRMAL